MGASNGILFATVGSGPIEFKSIDDALKYI